MIVLVAAAWMKKALYLPSTAFGNGTFSSISCKASNNSVGFMAAGEVGLLVTIREKTFLTTLRWPSVLLSNSTIFGKLCRKSSYCPSIISILVSIIVNSYIHLAKSGYNRDQKLGIKVALLIS